VANVRHDDFLDELLEDDPSLAGAIEDSQESLRLLAALRTARKAIGMNQTDVGEAMGIKQSAVSQFEQSTDPHLSTVQRYARAVGIHVGFELTPAQAGSIGVAVPSPDVEADDAA